MLRARLFGSHSSLHSDHTRILIRPFAYLSAIATLSRVTFEAQCTIVCIASADVTKHEHGTRRYSDSKSQVITVSANVHEPMSKR